MEQRNVGDHIVKVHGTIGRINTLLNASCTCTDKKEKNPNNKKCNDKSHGPKMSV